VPAGCGTISIRSVSNGTNTDALGCTGSDGTGYVDATTLHNNGTYAVVIDPSALNVGTATVRLISVHDQHLGLTINGPSVVATVSGPGGQSFLTFSATAGQKLTLDINGASADFDGCGTVSVTDANNRILDYGCIKSDGTGTMGPETVPTTGTYTIVVNPSALNIGSVTLRLHT
jgi:hypothetical protein